ncbi:extracellular solute-binding protein [Microvirga brassicacearum]|uniref:Extracellular solute-binding protein n=1 Tax=Microvirga brassicacearum TaxID=2580413 RepID=A0A5N3PBZ8_9HYPH|nr:extracellular solute-binding protein [Microvirga brassicacearum]KAB0267231.1 extracellular solute-binding protein [Microvirga brassicacearum]
MNTYSSAAPVTAALPSGSPSRNAGERVLRVTTWSGSYRETYESLVTEFESIHDCKVQWVVGSSADHLTNSRLGYVDVATNTLLNSIAGEKEDLWEPLDATQVPNMKNLYPNAIHSPYTIFANVGDYVLVYDSTHVTDGPTSWDALWDPRYKNRVVILGLDQSSSLSLAVLQSQKAGGSIDDMQPGLKRMAALIESGNLIRLADSESEVVSSLQAGNAWLAVLPAGRVKELWQNRANNIKIARPSEGTFPLISTVNVTRSATDLTLAMAFVNHVLSQTWQEAFALNSIYAPVVANAVIPKDFAYGELLVQNEAFRRLFLPDQDKVVAQKASWLEVLNNLPGNAKSLAR